MIIGIPWIFYIVHFVKDGGDMFQQLHDALGVIVVTTLGIQQ
jgi:hypothetical protein